MSSTTAEVPRPERVIRVYLVLMLCNTLAGSFIWGINTLFLLDAGLNATAAFAANAFFTAGMVLFEVPTGVVADTWGRRVSYLLGTVTLVVATALYLLAWQAHAPFWAWIVTSILLGLGFTFFSGATEAWLVDALRASGYEGELDPVFARGQVIGGVAMLIGTAGGGLIAQWTNLGVPYMLRSATLVVSFVVAFLFMRDWGFTPRRARHPLREMRRVLAASTRYGFGVAPVRWTMLSAVAVQGVGIYAFYAVQPYLLELWGDQEAYGIAGLAAAVTAGAMIAGGLLAPRLRRLFHHRTSALLVALAAECVLLVLLGSIQVFWVAVIVLVGYGMAGAAALPIRQAFMNGMIPSEQRATVLSFDSLLSSSGGVVIQPALGRAADAWSYSASLVAGGIISMVSLPFLALARRERPAADTVAEPAPSAPPA
jgi:MFS family permease